MDSQIAQLQNGLLTFARYGDWCSVSDGAGTGCGFTRGDISTFMFVRGLDILAEFANKTGNNGDYVQYSTLSATTKALYNKQWWNAAGGYYSDNYPISQILALDLEGLVPNASRTTVFNTLVNLIQSGTHSGFANHSSGGIIFQKVGNEDQP